MITLEIKKRILDAIRQQRQSYPSNSKMSVALGISASQFSRIMSGDTTNVISDAKWISIARKLEVQLTDEPAWITANTHVFDFITRQLTVCQDSGISGLLCDMADIGKTYAAKYYAKAHRNAVYIDCSQSKSKQRLVRKIAKEYGLQHAGRYSDIYEDLVFYLKSIPTPIIILDEAGDLDYAAFLELKALWNATERACGWYMMGADGLKAKIEANLGRKKVGYAEIFSRFGNRFQKVSPDGGSSLDTFSQHQAALICKANGITSSKDISRIYARSQGSLRRIFTEVQKQTHAQKSIHAA
jgi:DNA transposition AAA+ family ATPase